ncbi:hypothetical protein [uncultured Mucilaginibacter sp.]|uniref:hypothetical protein n=1 Tax=uncultured Mucilaginibacter sp. TaxID=797541 RepID=UPI0025E91552|nr:hypothetical protein [uncultured Mucilaginibacter sp.]
MYHPFTIADTLKAAWIIFKRNFITIIVYSVVAFFVLLILGMILAVLFTADNFFVELIVWAITLFVQSYTTLGLYKLIFTLIDSEFYEFKITQILPKFTMTISFAVVQLLFATLLESYKFILDHILPEGVIMDIAILLGSFGVLYIVLRGMYSPSFIVDDASGPIESIRQSFQLTKGYFMSTLATLGIIILLIAVPAVLSKYILWAPLFIIFSYPFVNIFLMEAYRKLVYSHQDVDDLDTETV